MNIIQQGKVNSMTEYEKGYQAGYKKGLEDGKGLNYSHYQETSKIDKASLLTKIKQTLDELYNEEI